ncbi:hypothetical protein QJS10_CPB22g00671 [Acorus calamus]|uniref:Uncharacterized protein n=1 Tax=Acorus calamus TaxID=4465 RepID=A0AAV9C074_ACOCL|nr:hypothetical protein QJS10_CPB22g00671 [Acorus calamus]
MVEGRWGQATSQRTTKSSPDLSCHATLAKQVEGGFHPILTEGAGHMIAESPNRTISPRKQMLIIGQPEEESHLQKYFTTLNL